MNSRDPYVPEALGVVRQVDGGILVVADGDHVRDVRSDLLDVSEEIVASLERR